MSGLIPEKEVNVMGSEPILYHDDVEVGMEIPALQKKPTSLQLFRYSAVTWNAHRIHYEKDYALFEGHPDILVQAHLHGSFLIQMVLDWIGPAGRLKKVSWSNRNRAVPGDTLTCKGKVINKFEENGEALIECEIAEENQRGEVCAPGKAIIALPRRG